MGASEPPGSSGDDVPIDALRGRINSRVERKQQRLIESDARVEIRRRVKVGEAPAAAFAEILSVEPNSSPAG